MGYYFPHGTVEAPPETESVFVENVVGNVPLAVDFSVDHWYTEEQDAPSGAGCPSYGYTALVEADLTVSGLVAGKLDVLNAEAGAWLDGRPIQTHLDGSFTKGRVEHFGASSTLQISGRGLLDVVISGTVQITEIETCFAGYEAGVWESVLDDTLEASVDLAIRARGRFDLWVNMNGLRNNVFAERWATPATPFTQSISTWSTSDSTVELEASRRFSVVAVGEAEESRVRDGGWFSEERSESYYSASGAASAFDTKVRGKHGDLLLAATVWYDHLSGSLRAGSEEAVANLLVEGAGQRLSGVGDFATHGENWEEYESEERTFSLTPSESSVVLSSSVRLPGSPEEDLPRVRDLSDDVLEAFPLSWLEEWFPPPPPPPPVV